MGASETVLLNVLGITSALKQIQSFFKISCFHQGERYC